MALLSPLWVTLSLDELLNSSTTETRPPPNFVRLISAAPNPVRVESICVASAGKRVRRILADIGIHDSLFPALGDNMGRCRHCPAWITPSVHPCATIHVRISPDWSFWNDCKFWTPRQKRPSQRYGTVFQSTWHVYKSWLPRGRQTYYHISLVLISMWPPIHRMSRRHLIFHGTLKWTMAWNPVEGLSGIALRDCLQDH